MEGISAIGGILFFLFFVEDIPSVVFMYLVFTRTPGGVTVGESGLCGGVPCLSSTIISLCLLIQFRHRSDNIHSDTHVIRFYEEVHKKKGGAEEGGRNKSTSTLQEFDRCLLLI